MSVHVRGVEIGTGVRSTVLVARLCSAVMNPAEAHQIEVHASLTPGPDLGLELMVGMRLAVHLWDYTVLRRESWTPDQLADVYELAHHKLHGVDERGLDPREGRTRLTVRGSPTEFYGEQVHMDPLGRLVGTRSGIVYRNS